MVAYLTAEILALRQQLIVLKRNQKRILRGYFDYHNNDRTHLGPAKEAPVGRPVSKFVSVSDQLLEMPKVGGLAIDMNGVKPLEFLRIVICEEQFFPVVPMTRSINGCDVGVPGIDFNSPISRIRKFAFQR